MATSRLRRAAWFMPIIVGLGASATRLAEPPIGRQSDGSWLVPTGQRLTQVGLWHVMANERPKDLAVSPDGSMVAVLCPRKVVILDSSGS